MRAGFAQVLQEIRRPVRRLGGQAGVSRVRGRRARASRSPDRRIPRPAPAARPAPLGRRRHTRSVIDLHTHTTASDGRCTPRELVDRAARAGVQVLSVTDHDTVAGCAAVAESCSRAGVEFVAGIEITAVVDGSDVHVLGYFIDAAAGGLQAFLAEQRRRRVDRVREMIARLAANGITLDAEAVLQPGLEDSSRSAGRPWIARALVAGGHVENVSDAFDRWLSPGRPAFVPRVGPSPEEVFSRIHGAGGVASLAHPVLVEHDEWIPAFAAAGMDALEAYHTDHDARATRHYLDLAADLELAVSGGSDYHADDAHGGGGPGSVSLPRPEFDRLKSLTRQK
ncbi:MAG: PHP domain-containing protein [Luteitalea sp.]|nr:PHP domain-containing protein [Luteitalea sp.]